MAARTNQLREEHSKGNYKAGPAYGQNTHTHTHSIYCVKKFKRFASIVVIHFGLMLMKAINNHN